MPDESLDHPPTLPLRPAADPVGQTTAPGRPATTPPAPSDLTAAATRGQAADPTAADEPLPVVPGYELLAEVGRGGMGVVYRALDTALGRDVAVKLLQARYGVGSATARRFTEEAQITGQLQHPGIPAVHQVGTLADGRPFLAMKLIRGRTLDEMLRERPDPAADRGRFVAVFEDVCQAVGYAHAHRVVHRDLKPLNVMVGAFGEVQVMDWGLAKVLTSGGVHPRRPADDDALGTEIRSQRGAFEATLAGSLLGTPAYMPPEQAAGAVDQIDERSDVFGLGGVLCAVLTGQPPYVGDTAEAIRQLAVWVRLDGAFARLDACGAAPELVALCKRCLSARREDRPADAGAVARAVADLRAAAEERAKKAEMDRLAADVRAAEERKRRRVFAGAAVAVVAALAAGTVAAAWQAVRAEGAAANARTAEAAARAAEATAAAGEQSEKKAREEATALVSLIRDVFAQGSPEGQARQAGEPKELKRNLTVEEAMDNAAERVAGKFGGRPEVEAAIRDAIGMTYFDLAAFAKALPHLRRALALREQALGPDSVPALTSTNRLGELYRVMGNEAEAKPLLERARAGFEKVRGAGDPETLRSVNNLGLLHKGEKDYGTAEALLKQALAGRGAALRPDHPDTLKSANNLAALYYELRRYPEAEPLFARALAGRERELGPDHPSTLASVNNLGELYRTTGNYAAAEPLLRRALAGREKVSGPDHPSAQAIANNLALLYHDTGNHAAAERLFRRVLAARQRDRGPGDPATLRSAWNLAYLYDDMKRPADAEPLWRQTLAGYEGLQPKSVFVPLARARLGGALSAQGKYAEAGPLLRDGFRGLRARNGSRAELRAAADHLARLCEATGRPAEAAAWRAERAKYRELAPKPRPATS